MQRTHAKATRRRDKEERRNKIANERKHIEETRRI